MGLVLIGQAIKLSTFRVFLELEELELGLS